MKTMMQFILYIQSPKITIQTKANKETFWNSATFYNIFQNQPFVSFAKLFYILFHK